MRIGKWKSSFNLEADLHDSVLDSYGVDAEGNYRQALRRSGNLSVCLYRKRRGEKSSRLFFIN